jgi:galactose mutarotase-like enzyme
MEKISHLGETLTRWRVGRSTFLALPEKGARLMNWNLTLGDGSVRDIIFWPELTTFENFYKVRGGNPILFPFNARTFDRGDIHFWRAADDVRRPMPMHGVARQADFKVTRLDAGGFTAVMIPNAESRACYPYEHEFAVTYRFTPLGLSCEFALTNHGQEPIPWSAGHHFYFTVPWTEGAKRADYVIRIHAAKRLKQDFANGQLIPGPALQAVEPLSNPALVDTLHTELTHGEVVFGERDLSGKRDRVGDIAVQLGAGKVPPPGGTFVTWTLDDAAPFFCVEPWMGPPNAAEHKIGLHFVKPGATERFSVSVSLK